MRYSLYFFVPASHLESVKAACFAAGAGRLGAYEYCAWQVLGRGQYRPMAGSCPYQGTLNQLEAVNEYRVEMVVQQNLIRSVVKSLVAAHPYEEPAYGVFKILTLSDL